MKSVCLSLHVTAFAMISLPASFASLRSSTAEEGIIMLNKKKVKMTAIKKISIFVNTLIFKLHSLLSTPIYKYEKNTKKVTFLE